MKIFPLDLMIIIAFRSYISSIFRSLNQTYWSISILLYYFASMKTLKFTSINCSFLNGGNTCNYTHIRMMIDEFIYFAPRTLDYSKKYYKFNNQSTISRRIHTYIIVVKLQDFYVTLTKFCVIYFSSFKIKLKTGS